ncbi:hypothetical protein SHELI_v1c03700 [Spiroplasma helicoides]|uniref:Fido domain-containing protein n=1 Tax=Spiroplasma helicoides TaxID=216938 RepID=A0A1B3SK63_9MOLU|nr:hypothetical protein [Spiroplasma helicoides]AOG60323.1 hypothetical protein SHELI_v1c03700 [Spiroplasma helicoides]
MSKKGFLEITYSVFNDRDRELFDKLLTNTIRFYKINPKNIKYISNNNLLNSIEISEFNNKTIKINLLYVSSEILTTETFYETFIKGMSLMMNSLPSYSTKVGPESFVPDYLNGAQKSAISSMLLYKWQDESINHIDKAIDLLFRYCRGHFISNGNKRSAVLFTLFYVNYFSMNFYGNKHSDIKDIDTFEIFVHEIITNQEHQQNQDYQDSVNNIKINQGKELTDEEIRIKIYDFISKNLVINLE